MLRRHLLAAASALALTLAGCSHVLPTPAKAGATPPIVFVHGNGDNAAVWMTTLWRFESNGWRPDQLHAIHLPDPLAREDDARPQPGRTSTTEHMGFLRGEVDKVLAATGARQVVLIGNSRGGNAIRNYIQNGGGADKVSHAILGGTPNHGVWALPDYLPGNEFNGAGPFLRGLNTPKNAAGDEVTGPVRWMTIRSDNNDKFAQPEGTWIGRRGQPTNVTAAGPELRGAENVVIPRIDHRETSFSPEAFAAMHRFLTGQAPEADIVPQPQVQLSGLVNGLGLSSTDPASGNFANNKPLPGATLEVFAVGDDGARRGDALLRQTIRSDGRWGPLRVAAATRLEFVVAASGYATTHTYRSPFPRSTDLVILRPERLAEADRSAGAVVVFTRPRGYFDLARDRMALDGQSPPPGIPPGAGASSTRIRPAFAGRPVTAEFNGERLVGRLWPAAEQRVTVLELHR